MLVAQWTRARGYEPLCRGLESLLARLSKFYSFQDKFNVFIELFIETGVSPSGKAADFDSATRRFESSYPSIFMRDSTVIFSFYMML